MRVATRSAPRSSAPASASASPFRARAAVTCTAMLSQPLRGAAAADPSSLSNPGEARVVHADLALCVDFGTRRVVGTAALRVRAEAAAVPQLRLDTRGLHVASATWRSCDVGGRFDADSAAVDVAFALGGEQGALGTPLSVALPPGLAQGATGVVTLAFATSPQSSACQWLEPAQTAGGTHPYLFTQCQAIHARALLPVQDSPAAKLTYAAIVTVPAPLTALMSAVAVDEGDMPESLLAAATSDAASRHGAAAAAAAAYPGAATRTFRFMQRVPVAPYLIALAAGELSSRELGPRSRVWSEPSMVAAGEHEFADTEAFVAAAEAVVGPYVWGRYDLLLLPPSFPYGGMENPCLTFVTPTLLAGDRSLANVVAHEVAHSWSGNLVTNAGWNDFWLNEGLTVLLERKILQRLRGEGVWAFHAAGGWRALKKEVARLGAEHPYTRLVVDLSGGADPDDAFSRIPYEKGFACLVHLERCAGGPAVFEAFLRDAYLRRFAYGAVTTADFVASYTAAFPAAASAVDWQAWLHAPGMPPVDVAAGYDTSLRDASDAAAMAWHTADVLGTGTPAAAGGWPAAVPFASSEQLVAFLERLGELRAATPLALPAVRALDAAYTLSGARNAEVRAAWLRLRVAAGDVECLDAAAAFLTEQGRMKYLRPLYRQLRRSKAPQLRAAAADIFARARGAYHPIAAKMVAQDLGQAELA